MESASQAIDRKTLDELNTDFSRMYIEEQKLYKSLVKLEKISTAKGDAPEYYDKFLGVLIQWSDLKERRMEVFKDGLEHMGFTREPAIGSVRIFRGVEWPWDTKKVLSNQYWIEDPDFALDFAKQGDLVVLDVPETNIVRVKDPEKAGEIQLPNPQLAENAKIIIRNGRLADPNKPPTPNLKNLLMSILGDRNTKPKPYDMLHDEYINLDK